MTLYCHNHLDVSLRVGVRVFPGDRTLTSNLYIYLGSHYYQLETWAVLGFALAQSEPFIPHSFSASIRSAQKPSICKFTHAISCQSYFKSAYTHSTGWANHCLPPFSPLFYAPWLSPRGSSSRAPPVYQVWQNNSSNDALNLTFFYSGIVVYIPEVNKTLCYSKGSPSLIKALWIPVLCFETLLCALALLRGYRVSDPELRGNGSLLMTILIRDSAIYYLL